MGGLPPHTQPRARDAGPSRCAYWLSLFDAPDGAETGSTVYLPRQNVLAVESLRKLMTAFSLGQRPPYAP